MIRLQKYLAHAGIGSLRTCEHLITEGKVKVNGDVVTQMGVQIDPEKDVILFKGRPVAAEQKKVTVLLNKPEGYVTTAKDQFGRPSVLDLVDMPEVRLYPIGRLDYQTSGMLLLTNDGDLTNGLTHPRHHVAKTYEALLQGEIKGEDLERLRRGVVLDDGYRTKPAKVRLLGLAGHNSRVEITIFEGKNHQVRRMAKAVHHPVLRLQRVRIGEIGLGNLKEGSWRKLTEKEIRMLKDACAAAGQENHQKKRK